MFNNIKPTKGKILLESAMLFAERGYDRVSLDDIAKAVGIKKPSIFNHFTSKRDILNGLYVEYEKQRKNILPDLGGLLEQCETVPPLELLQKVEYHFDPETEAVMNCVLAIAAQYMSTDMISRDFIQRNVLSAPHEHLKPLLYKMIELGKIEPLDVEAFCSVVRDYCFASVAYIATPMRLGHDRWREGLCYLFRSCVRPT